MKPRITDLFNIKYPTIQGGLPALGNADLGAAVSNAGGLGEDYGDDTYLQKRD